MQLVAKLNQNLRTVVYPRPRPQPPRPIPTLMDIHANLSFTVKLWRAGIFCGSRKLVFAAVHFISYDNKQFLPSFFLHLFPSNLVQEP